MPMKTINCMESPGIVRDVPAHALADNAFTEGENIRFNEMGIESLAGDLSTFSSASITPLWVGYFPPIGNPKWVYADLAEVWVVENTTHNEITRASGDYSGNASERWQSTILNGVAVLNNTIDIPQSWSPIDSGTKLVDMPNWDTARRAKSIRSFKNFLIALNLTDSGTNRPYRILWSDSADTGTLPGSWDSTDPTTDSREFDLASTSDYLVDQLNLGDINIVYKESSTWGMQYIGPPNYFRFWQILGRKGLLARDCMAQVPLGHLIVTQDDIILHQGQVEQYSSILNSKMKRWLFAAIDPDNFKNSFVFANPKFNEAYFCFPEVGSTYANRALVWNWDNNSIGIKAIDTTPFASIGPLGAAITDDLEWGV